MIQRKPDLDKVAERIATANKDGLEELADERPAAERRNESALNKYFRKFKTMIGLDESDSKVINLN